MSTNGSRLGKVTIVPAEVDSRLPIPGSAGAWAFVAQSVILARSARPRRLDSVACLLGQLVTPLVTSHLPAMPVGSWPHAYFTQLSYPRVVSGIQTPKTFIASMRQMAKLVKVS